MKPTIVEFVTDPQLLGLNLSPAQETLLRAIYALPPVSDEHVALYRQCTGRADWPTAPFQEVTAICGARSGKSSRVAGVTALYEALFGTHGQHLHRGEVAIIPIVAQDARAARIVFGYVRDFATETPLLAGEVADVLASELVLRNGTRVVCFPCVQKSLRGWSIPCAVLDEVAYFRLEGAADSDVEIQSAVRRGMVNFPSTRLLKISTPFLRSGVLFDDAQRFGVDDPLRLVWRASSVLMNPTLAPRLEREAALDPVRFRREFEAEFLQDADTFLPAAWVEGAVHPGRYELPPREGVTYIAAVDPSGGGADAFTLCVVHREGTGAEARVVVDVLKGWHRVGDALAAVVAEVAGIVQRYGLTEVLGDRYAAGWVRERFAEAGVRYREAPTDKSAAYLELEPLFAQGRVDLLDHPTLVRELRNLEKRALVGGKVRIDHPRGGHDDYANALALAAAEGASRLVYGVHYRVF
jgi:hypothetical protein